MTPRLLSGGLAVALPPKFSQQTPPISDTQIANRSPVVAFITLLPKSAMKAAAPLSLQSKVPACTPFPSFSGDPCRRFLRFRVFSVAGDEFATAGAGASFYELLGISESVGFAEIKQAYKQMARKYHPDVSPADRAKEYTKRFISVQEAYETLSDPRRRAVYDRDLARGLHLAFSSRRRFDEDREEKSTWKNRWQDQVAELQRRSMRKDSEESMSWGARMRRQRRQSPIE